VAGYTNECNPFGDTNLTDRCAPQPRASLSLPALTHPCTPPPPRRSFVWHKKLEKQILDGADVRELGLKAERQRQKERMARAHNPKPKAPFSRALCRSSRLRLRR
jgi:hypothetical protein